MAHCYIQRIPFMTLTIKQQVQVGKKDIIISLSIQVHLQIFLGHDANWSQSQYLDPPIV